MRAVVLLTGLALAGCGARAELIASDAATNGDAAAPSCHRTTDGLCFCERGGACPLGGTCRARATGIDIEAVCVR